ncbi:MAG TPA: GIY-YIG nuclease family protein [Streptosporangiaceae bacterium]|nr:GIY-YIG nuclease family protein [Streptosporangiaceae bacterium]
MTGTEPSGQYHAQFRLSITRALGEQLRDALTGLVPALLDDSNLLKLRPESGVYQLFRDGIPVYIGKAEASLPDRLRQHLRKIDGRRNISASKMSFTCLYVAEDFSAVAPEKLLIRYFQGDGKAPWNNNGFGNNDPGRNRDHTVVKAGHFDAQFPIDPRVQVAIATGTYTAGRFLDALKNALPYNLRYDQKFKGKGRLALTSLEVNQSPMSARAAFKLIIDTLPPQWQLTALPGYAILYKETEPQAYDSALAWWRREEEDFPVTETPGRHLFSPGSVEDSDNEDGSESGGLD